MYQPLWVAAPEFPLLRSPPCFTQLLHRIYTINNPRSIPVFSDHRGHYFDCGFPRRADASNNQALLLKVFYCILILLVDTRTRNWTRYDPKKFMISGLGL
jgi:hypothetical protein